jgi:hypothetical protein
MATIRNAHRDGWGVGVGGAAMMAENQEQNQAKRAKDT